MAGAAQSRKDDPELDAFVEAQVAKAPPFTPQLAARLARALGMVADGKRTGTKGARRA